MVDYSKWNNIEISDDEDEEWPKIDRVSPSQENRQAQVEKMEEQKIAVEDYQRRKADYQKSMSETKEKILELQQVLKELEEQNENNETLGDKVMKIKKESSQYNVDKIDKPGCSKTMTNMRSSNEHLKYPFLKGKQLEFVIKHEKELKYYGMLCEFEDSRAYLKAHDYLLCEDTVNYLIYWGSCLEIEQNHYLRKRVARQIVCIRYILRSGKVCNRDPRAYLEAFFHTVNIPECRVLFEQKVEELNEEIIQTAISGVLDEVKISDDENEESRNICRLSLPQGNHQDQVEKMEEHNEEQNENNETLGDKLMKIKKELSQWNVDTIDKPGFSKTMTNMRSSNEHLKYPFLKGKQHEFVIKHEKELKYYGMLCQFEDSRAYLKAHDYLICDDAVDFLIFWGSCLEIEQKHDLRKRLTRQIICIRYILSLGKACNRDPRAYLDMFFLRVNSPDSRLLFEEQVKELNGQIVKRACLGVMGVRFCFTIIYDVKTSGLPIFEIPPADPPGVIDGRTRTFDSHDFDISFGSKTENITKLLKY